MNLIDDKYFRVCSVIDLDAIRTNYINNKANLPDGTSMIAVIKTDGYGHGAVPIARHIKDIAEGFAVATVMEAHNLRINGIDNDIFVLGYVPVYDMETAIDENIIVPVFDYESASMLSQKALEKNKTIRINIAVDTGMRRIGYRPDDDAIREIVEISKLDGVEIISTFTHFAKADYKDKTDARAQYNQFCEFVNKLKENGISPKYVQCANSAAIMEMPDTAFNMTRIGISLYGLYPSDEMNRDNIELKQSMTIISHVVYVKDVKKGEGISYGHTFVAPKDMRVATIPVGYGDGYPRNLSNKGYVLIGGKKAPILGRVCMDQFMVDVTDADVKRGDRVILCGKDEDDFISIDEYATLAGTFNYEFVCNISKRVPRVYISDGKVVSSIDYFDEKY